MAANDLINALAASLVAERKDQPGQAFWTEWRTGLVITGGPSAVGNIPLVSSTGKLDPSLIPGGSGGPSSFDEITSGTNISADMEVGTGATLQFTGGGVVNANEINTINIAGNLPSHQGQILISQPGNTTALWADPFVQGPWVDGTPIVTPGAMGDGTSNIQPVLVAGRGTSPSGQDGKMHALPLTKTGQAVFTSEEPEWNANSGGTDPYQRERVSTPTTLFEEGYEFFPVGPVTIPPTPTQFTLLTVGSGAFTRPAGFANITGTVGTDAGARAVWQTKTYFISQLGKGFGIYTSGNLGANIANVITRIGGYDDDHGAFFEQNGQLGVLRVATRTNGIDVGVPQSAWNIDKLDGTGNSGISLNMALGQVFTIDAGAGRVRFGVVINGIVYYCHAVNLANVAPAIAHAQVVVPVRFEILNAGISVGGSVSQSNLSVFADGGFEDNPSAFGFGVDTGTTLASITATSTPVLSIRPTLMINGHANRIFITLRDFAVFSLGQVVRYQLVWNGTLTGANFSPVNTVSAVEYDTAATTITGGRVVASGFIAAFAKDVTFSSDKFPFRLPFTLDITGTVQDVYTLVCTAVNNGTAMVGGSFKWQEER